MSFGSGGEGACGGRGGGHLSSKMLLVDRPFFPRFLQAEEQRTGGGALLVQVIVRCRTRSKSIGLRSILRMQTN